MNGVNKRNIANIVAISCITNKVVNKLIPAELNVDKEQIARVTTNKVLECISNHN